jgi:hypothetical protein
MTNEIDIKIEADEGVDAGIDLTIPAELDRQVERAAEGEDVDAVQVETKDEEVQQ